MIKITDRTKCSGCYSCFNACPKNCIEMKLDGEGFRYPSVDIKTCINCGLCEKVCPMTGGADGVRKERKAIIAAAGYDKNPENVRKSASGGIANLISEYVIENGGVVFGVTGNAVTEVKHVMASSKEELLPLQNSKYLQSNVGYSFREVKEQLESGKLVFFVGTPCQVAGLYGFLGEDRENLITADLVCHGVPSETVFKRYIKEFEEKKGKKVVLYCRDKSKGWKPGCYTYVFEDGETYTSGSQNDMFNRGFVTNLFQRPSCYTCPFAPLERIGDFTLGDWFGGTKWKELTPENTGLSMLTVNSPKGEALYEKLKEKMAVTEYPVEEAVRESAHMGKAPGMNRMRKAFFKEFAKKPYFEIYKKFYPSGNDYLGRLRNSLIRRKAQIFDKNMLK